MDTRGHNIINIHLCLGFQRVLPAVDIEVMLSMCFVQIADSELNTLDFLTVLVQLFI